MVSDRTILSYLFQLKYLTIFDRKKDEGPRNSKGFLNRYFSEYQEKFDTCLDTNIVHQTDSDILDLA